MLICVQIADLCSPLKVFKLTNILFKQNIIMYVLNMTFIQNISLYYEYLIVSNLL